MWMISLSGNVDKVLFCILRDFKGHILPFLYIFLVVLSLLLPETKEKEKCKFLYEKIIENI